MSRAKTRIVVLVLLVAAVAGYSAWRYAQRRGTAGVIFVSGRIEGDVSEIGSKVPARIVEITVREGDTVKTGQVLVRLDDEQVRARVDEAAARQVSVERQLERARLQVPVFEEQLRQSRLRESQSTLDAQGRVSQAEAQVAQAQAYLAQVTAELGQNRSDAKRYRDLADSGVVSRQLTEQYDTKVKSSEALLDAARKQVAAAEGALRTARSTLANPEIFSSATMALQRQLTQSRAEISALEAEVGAAAAQLTRARADLADLTVRSPIDGTVITRAAEPGKVTPAGATILTIVDLSGVYLRGFIPEGDIGHVRLGQRAEIALDSDPNKPLEGEVMRIDPQAMFTPENTYFQQDRVKQVVGVKILIKDPAGRAKPGMPADGRIFVVERRQTSQVGVLNAATEPPKRALNLNLRSRVEAFKGSGVWEEVRLQRSFPVATTAILICDMWDNHWCSAAAKRVEALARKMAPILDQARDRGVQIIHSPSDVMDFYKDAPQRRMMLELPKPGLPVALNLSDPPLPVDSSDGGCDTPDKNYKAWTRQHALLRIAPGDAVSDKGVEVYSLLRHKGIENLLVMGVHTNMCVLTRSFAIRQMTRWGIRCALVRDLTDAMYDPKDPPYVSHEQGTELVVEHIEKYWCPSLVSADLARALRASK